MWRLQMKPLLVGEAPSKNEVTETPLEGRVGRRLADLAGLTVDQYLARFDRVNLLHVRQDTKEKGFEFDLPAARDAVRELRRNGTLRDRAVVLLGHRVAEAFGVGNLRYFRGMPNGQGGMIWLMPHPSGVNRWWNDQSNCEEAREFMRGLLERTR